MPVHPVRTCVDRTLPIELMSEFARRSVEENSANAPAVNPRQLLPGVGPVIPMALPLLTGKLWKPGRTLRVRFLDGDPVVHERIQPYAHIWSQHANIKFEFGNDPESEIRVSFKQPGSWAYIGTDALVIPQTQPTMNLGWLSRAMPDDEYSRVVTHEFGHVLGAIHEHQSPVADIPWDKQAVYDFYKGPPNYWNKAQVDINLFMRYGAELTQYSAFDPASIMLYPVAEEFTVGDYAVGWNRQLSEIDKSFIGTIYPFAQKSVPALTIDAPATEAAIGTFGEMDTYTVKVDIPGLYRIETEGNTDLVMNLFGPDDETRFVAQDDDSGRNLNARIIHKLTPGTYTVRVRHFNENRTGSYQVGVTMEVE